MALLIGTNVASLVGQNQLTKNVNALQKTMTQLSTGLRINQAGDDAAGLTISERMKYQIRGSNKAMDNIQDSKNFINVADGGMISATDHVQRINELCVQAASDIYDVEGRRALFTEVKQRLVEINAIANGLTYNGQVLLDGSWGAQSDGTNKKMIVQTGAFAEVDPTKPMNTIDIAPALSNCQLTALGNTKGASATNVNPSGMRGIQLPTWLDPDHADFGDVTKIVDVSGNLAADQKYPQTAFASQHFGDAIRDYMVGIQKATDTLSFSRGLLGAYTTRLDSTNTNMELTVENLETAKSRITDVDVAKASSDMVKYQILQQTTASALMQANQLPSLALQLMGG